MCSLHGKSYDSKDTAFLLADITRNVAKGQRRLYVSRKGGCHGACCAAVCRPLRLSALATTLLVSSTAGIQAGHWVRVFARSPLRSGRRLLAEEGGEPLRANSTALGSRNSRVPAPVPAPEKPSVNSSSGTPSEDGFLPLPQAFIEGAQQAEELGLGGAEQSSPAGASAAVAPGTLDAYLYGFNAADSGSSERMGPAPACAAGCVEASAVELRWIPHAFTPADCKLLQAPSAANASALCPGGWGRSDLHTHTVTASCNKRHNKCLEPAFCAGCWPWATAG